MKPKVDIKFWLIGLASFGVLIAMSALMRGDSPFDIVDHQTAGTAMRVDEIQAAWSALGYRGAVIAGMFGDLVFITLYSLGAWRAGQSLLAFPDPMMRAIGALAAGTGVVFFVTDMVETLLQLFQMLQNYGVDWMAATAAFAQPIKAVAFIGSVIIVITGLIGARFSSSAT